VRGTVVVFRMRPQIVEPCHGMFLQQLHRNPCTRLRVGQRVVVVGHRAAAGLGDGV